MLKIEYLSEKGDLFSVTDRNDERAVRKAQSEGQKRDLDTDAKIREAVQNGLIDAIKRNTPPPGEA